MKKINKLLDLSINYAENLYKTRLLIKMDMKIFVILLLNIWRKQKLNFFINMNKRTKLNFFSNNKLKLQPRT